MKKNILAILVAAAGAWAAWADYATTLKYDDVPAHVTLTFSGSFQGDVNVSVAGAAAGATLSQYSYGSRGWTITATADTGYDEPVFRTCPYDDTGDILAETQIHTGSVTRTGYNIHVYDITVSPKLVTVYFNLVGGDLPAGASPSRIVPYDSSYGALPVPTRKGYTFDGWFTESEGGTQVTESDKMAQVASTQTLYAHWTPIKYTVAFKANGGSGTMPSMTLTYDQSANLVANAFTRAYYTFDKWRTTDGNYYGDCASVVNLAETEGAVVTLLAQWTPASYTVTFDSTGGTPIEAVTCQFGAAVPRPTDPTRDGYTFERWSPALPEKMPPTNLTVKAIWRVESYKLSFVANGGDGNESMPDVSAAAGSELTLPSNAFTRTGFAFAGWNTQPDGPGLDIADGARWSLTSNTTFYARWTPYVVTFSLADGGTFRQDSIDALEASGSVSNVVKVNESTLTAQFTEGRPFGVLPDATNVMTHFSLKLKNWRFVRDGVYQAIAPDMIVPPLALGGTNLVAQWDWEPSDKLAAALDAKNLAWSIDYVWTTNEQYKTSGGQSASIQVDSADYVDVAAAGYKQVKLTTELVGPGTLTFDWRMESAAIGSWPVSSQNTWKNTLERLLFCIGKVDTSTYSTSLSDLDSDKFKCGFAADLNNWVSVTNYAGTSGQEGVIASLNEGWQSCTITDLAGAGAVETNTVTWVFQCGNYLSSNIPPWPARVWIDNVRWTGKGTVAPPPIQTYSVEFDKNGGEGTMTTLVVDDADGTNLTANAFSRSGYTFGGWNTQSNGTGLAIADGARLSLATNVTLYAQWSTNVATITFDSAGGSSVAPITQTCGTTVTAPADPVHPETGYVFAGWSPVVPATMPASDLTVTAQWGRESYWIVFDTEGGSEVAAINLEFGATVVPPTDPEQEGCTFKGWSPALPQTMPASNLWVAAQWTTNSYVITFDAAGGSDVPPMTNQYGSVVTLPADPVRTGYAFGGWMPALPEMMPASDLTVTAQWTALAYTITFDSAGGSFVAPIVQHYGTAVTAPADPVRPGYVFAGWTPALPATMPASDLTVTATWTADPTNPEQKTEGMLYSHVTSDPVESAVTYDGCLYDAQGRVAGIVQVKRGKYSAQKDLAKVTATVTLAGKKKLSYAGGTWHSDSEHVTLTSAKDACVLKVVLGARGLSGEYGGEYAVDGAANLFTSKDAGDKAVSAAVLNSIKAAGGGYVLAVPSDAGWGGLTIAVKTRGKVSVTGTLAGGMKVNVSSQLLIGEEACCIPVVSPKFAEPAFVVWLTRDGGVAEVVGLDGAKLAAVKSGLAAGATFKVDEAALVTMLGSSLRMDYLPNGFSVTAAGTKWLVENGAKAGQVKMDRQTGELTTTSENWASLKLTYKAKTGQFSGSFKAYMLADGKLKSATVKVAGVLVDGTGYGTATVKKQSATVTVASENN